MGNAPVADPDSTEPDSPEALPQYIVKGRSYVGGVVGYHYTTNVSYSYSNANVIATEYYAGGISGAYRNNYIVTKISGKDNYSYSTATMYYNYFAELETAGKCLEWVKDHLALDEIGIYLKKEHVAESKESVFTSLYDYMTDVVEKVPAGCGGVIFTPWLHGNRCPFEGPNARGMFFNISLETGKNELIRSVLEGVCHHLHWFIETQEKKVKTSDTIRFVGGGALSRVTCQISADCTGKTVEVTAEPQNVGSVGAAMTAAVGLGLIKDLQQAKSLIPAEKTYKPNPANRAVYDKSYEVYKQLYKSNKAHFDALNKS